MKELYSVQLYTLYLDFAFVNILQYLLYHAFIHLSTQRSLHLI